VSLGPYQRRSIGAFEMALNPASDRVSANSRRSTILTSSANDFARILCMALARCSFTVTSLNPKLAAICLFSSPATIRVTTSLSRALNESRCSRNVEIDCSSSRRATSYARAVETASSRSWLQKGLVRKSTTMGIR
jgi:hypothetical protein